MAARIVLFVALIFAGGAAYVSYNTSNELKTTHETLTETEGTLSKTQKTLKTTEADRDSEKAAKEASEKKAAGLETDLASSKQAQSDAEAAATQAKSELETVKADALESKQALADLKSALGPKSPSQLIAEVQGLQSSVEELTGKLKGSEDQLAATKSQLDKMLAEEESRRKGISAPGVTGRVVAVNSQWNFVVLDVGREQGIAENSELTVVRDNQPIAKVRISQVYPNSCVADLVKVLKTATPNVGDGVFTNQ